jgi:hypothetical protein
MHKAGNPRRFPRICRDAATDPAQDARVKLQRDDNLMELSKIDFQANEAKIAFRRRRLRRVQWGLMIFCTLMIAIVVLSQTRIATRAQSDPARPSALVAAPSADAGLTAAFAQAVDMADRAPTAPAPASTERPVVRAMPSNRVPVLRAGISVDN